MFLLPLLCTTTVGSGSAFASCDGWTAKETVCLWTTFGTTLPTVSGALSLVASVALCVCLPTNAHIFFSRVVRVAQMLRIHGNRGRVPRQIFGKAPSVRTHGGEK